MRVISVQPHFRAGGAEMQTLLLSNELVRRGVETHLVLHNAEGELLGELAPQVVVHDLGLESHAALPLIAARAARKLGEFADGLVIVKLWASLFAVAPTAARRHSLTFAMCEDLDPVEHWRHTKFGRPKQSIIKTIFTRSRLVTANTEAVADGMIGVYGLRRRPDVVYGGVDVPRIRAMAAAATAPSADGEAIRIVTVASLRERKGHPRMLAGLMALDEPWVWDVVGDGPESAALKRSVPAQLRDRVRFHGAVSNPYPFVAAADVLLHLPYSEAFGVVVLESLALGVPVVCSPTIGPLEISRRLDPERLHLRFADPARPREIAAEVARAAASGAAVPSAIVEPFNIVATADNWLELAGRQAAR